MPLWSCQHAYNSSQVKVAVPKYCIVTKTTQGECMSVPVTSFLFDTEAAWAVRGKVNLMFVMSIKKNNLIKSCYFCKLTYNHLHSCINHIHSQEDDTVIVNTTYKSLIGLVGCFSNQKKQPSIWRCEQQFGDLKPVWHHPARIRWYTVNISLRHGCPLQQLLNIEIISFENLIMCTTLTLATDNTFSLFAILLLNKRWDNNREMERDG